MLAEGRCKFEDCITFRLWIESKPEGTNDVIINFLTYGSISNQHNDNETAFSRRVSGEIRQEVSSTLSKYSPINCYYEQFNESKNLSAAKHGNFTHLHSQALLRKIKAEQLSKERYDCDMWLDVVGTKRTYDATINGNVIHGYIQTLVREPVIIHMFSDEQILLLKHFDLTKISLHLDATGSVVRKIDKQQKAFLYYALTIRHLNTKTCPVPLAEMLSSDHTNIEISHFKNKWLYSVKDRITSYPQGVFIPVDQKWQKDKCKMLKLSYIIGIVSEDQSTEKKLDIRRFAPSKEKRISPDGNCLFSSLSYVITGTDCFHKEIREILLENMKGQYKDICTNYCCSHYELLPESRCHSVDDYITKSKMQILGSWGTDMEIFLAAQLLTTDIFVYRDSLQCWNKFSGYGFNTKKDVHELNPRRIYLRLHHDHFQKKKVDKVKIEEFMKICSGYDENDPRASYKNAPKIYIA